MAIQAAQQAAQQRNQQARQALLNSAEQVVPQAGVNLNAANPIGLISQGLSGATNALTAGSRRAVEQSNLDRANALRMEQQEFERGQLAQQRQDKLGAQALDEAFRNRQLTQQGQQWQQSFDAGREDAAATAAYRANVLSGQQADRQATADYRTQTLEQQRELSQPRLQEGMDAEGNPVFFRMGSDGKTSIVEDVVPRIKPNATQAKVLQESKDAATRGYADNLAYENDLNDITPQDVENTTGFWSQGPTIAPESKASFAKLNKIVNKDFGKAFQGLRGGGQITNIEGAKATSAINMLVDEEGNVRKGLPADTVNTALSKLRIINDNEARINDFIAQNGGAEPSLDTMLGLLRVGDQDGNLIQVAGEYITELDLRDTSRKHGISRSQVINQILGGAQ